MDSVALTVGLLLVAALALGAAAVRALRNRNRAQLERRLGASGSASRPAVPDSRASTFGARAARLAARALSPLAVLSMRPEDAKSELALRLVHAGFRTPSAPRVFEASRFLAAAAGLGIYLAAVTLVPRPLPGGPALGIVLLAGGYYLPSIWLTRRTRSRHAQIEHGLPDALDLLVTCVEAGLGLDAALQRVAAAMALARPLLSHELQLTFLEVNAAIPRTEAMRRLADRNGVPELKSLAATLNQTEMFGTSVADALRIQADGMRTRRMQRAEERAATASVKLTIPLVLFILPSLFAVIVGPAIVNIVRAITPMLQRLP